MFDIPDPTGTASILLTTGLGKILKMMKIPQVSNKDRLTAIDEFNDALDRNTHRISRNELAQYRNIVKHLYLYWLAMTCYGWRYEQAVEYLESGICQYN